MHKSLLMGAISFLFLSVLSCTQQGKKVFKLNTPDEEVFKVIRHAIKDEQGKTFEIIAYNNWGLLFTKIYLLENEYCIDSFLLHDDSPYLLSFELLPSKKTIHAIYSLRSSLQDPTQQVIIKVKNKKIFVPLWLSHETDVKTSIGTGSTDILNEMYSSRKIDLKLLDSKNQCVVKFVEYEKMYDYKTKKFDISRDKGTYTYYYDPNSQVYCDSVKQFDISYEDCNGQKKKLTGRYPVQNYGVDSQNKPYFMVFIGLEWHVYQEGNLSPLSNRCY